MSPTGPSRLGSSIAVLPAPVQSEPVKGTFLLCSKVTFSYCCDIAFFISADKYRFRPSPSTFAVRCGAHGLDRNSDDLDGRVRFVLCIPGHFGDCIRDFLARNNFTKHGVVSVKVLCWRNGDEKLTPVCVWPRIGHGENTRAIEFAIGNDFVLYFVSGRSVAATCRIS